MARMGFNGVLLIAIGAASVCVIAGVAVENLQMLEDGRAQIAGAQADVLPGPSARILAVLYDDTFQLLVGKDSRFDSFASLRGQRIALPPSGGQFQSFLRWRNTSACIRRISSLSAPLTRRPPKPS